MCDDASQVTVYYGLNGQTKQLCVNQEELISSLRTLARSDAVRSVSSLLNASPSEWANALGKQDPPLLQLTEDVCETPFMTEFWRLRTNATRVECLLRNAAKAKKAKQDQEETAALVKAFESGMDNGILDVNNVSSTDVLKWKREHGLA